jgi:hypothetical protein
MTKNALMVALGLIALTSGCGSDNAVKQDDAASPPGNDAAGDAAIKADVATNPATDTVGGLGDSAPAHADSSVLSPDVVVGPVDAIVLDAGTGGLDLGTGSLDVGAGKDGSADQTPDQGNVSGVDGAADIGKDIGKDLAVDSVVVPPPDGPAADVASSGCSYPACVAAMFEACNVAGDCRTSTDTSTQLVCWDNGVKVSFSYDATLKVMVRTFKNAGGTCYDLLFDSGNSYKAAIRDASGVTVATVSTETGKAIVTCPGAQPVTLSDECGYRAVVPTALDSNDCRTTSATCVP